MRFDWCGCRELGDRSIRPNRPAATVLQKTDSVEIKVVALQPVNASVPADVASVGTDGEELCALHATDGRTVTAGLFLRQVPCGPGIIGVRCNPSVDVWVLAVAPTSTR